MFLCLYFIRLSPYPQEAQEAHQQGSGAGPEGLTESRGGHSSHPETYKVSHSVYTLLGNLLMEVGPELLAVVASTHEVALAAAMTIIGSSIQGPVTVTLAWDCGEY